MQNIDLTQDKVETIIKMLDMHVFHAQNSTPAVDYKFETFDEDEQNMSKEDKVKLIKQR